MKNTLILLVVLAALAAGFAFTSMPAVAQSGPAKATPRLPNGKPDFTGNWDHPRVGDVSKDVKGRCAGETPGCSSVSSGDLSFTPLGKTENEKKDKWDYG